jgi:hypothetical protein
MVKKIFRLIYDIIRDLNAPVWGGVEEAHRVGK